MGQPAGGLPDKAGAGVPGRRGSDAAAQVRRAVTVPRGKSSVGHGVRDYVSRAETFVLHLRTAG